jgi:hypothetical protein
LWGISNIIIFSSIITELKDEKGFPKSTHLTLHFTDG